MPSAGASSAGEAIDAMTSSLPPTYTDLVDGTGPALRVWLVDAHLNLVLGD